MRGQINGRVLGAFGIAFLAMFWLYGWDPSAMFSDTTKILLYAMNVTGFIFTLLMWFIPLPAKKFKAQFTARMKEYEVHNEFSSAFSGTEAATIMAQVKSSLAVKKYTDTRFGLEYLEKGVDALWRESQDRALPSALLCVFGIGLAYASGQLSASESTVLSPDKLAALAVLPPLTNLLWLVGMTYGKTSQLDNLAITLTA
jgi:hypothetical protein